MLVFISTVEWVGCALIRDTHQGQFVSVHSPLGDVMVCGIQGAWTGWRMDRLVHRRASV